jgi:hypothetical protein
MAFSSDRAPGLNDDSKRLLPVVIHHITVATSGNVHVPGLPGNRSNQVIQINQVARNTTWSHEVSVLIPGQIQTGQSSFQVASRGMLELSDCGSVNGAHL